MTDLARQACTVDQLLIDRGYINSTLVDDVLTRRGTIVCKPSTNRGNPSPSRNRAASARNVSTCWRTTA
jgi:hypothetical protein